MRCIPHGRWGLWLNVNRNAKITLLLINFLIIQPYSLIKYRIKFNLQNPGSESRNEHATSME